MLERIPDDEGVAIKRLRIPPFRHHRIRAQPAGQRRVNPPRPHQVQPQALLLPLAGDCTAETQRPL